ncbi:T9SS type A sorting domain-containing protein [Soonwooa purpurea]
MKKFYSVLLMAILSLVKAQMTYTAANYANVSDQANYHLGNTSTSLNFAATGANFQWNFGAVQNQSSKQIAYADPSTSVFKNLWCQSLGYTSDCDVEFSNNFNVAQKLINNPEPAGTNSTLEDLFAHYYKSYSDFSTKMLGLKMNSSGNEIVLTLNYQQPDVMYKFPMNYNDSYTEAFSYDGESMEQSFLFKINGTGTRTNVVDGYGNLVINNQTFSNVLRLKTISDQQITIVQNSGTQQRSIKTINYQWFHQDYKFPVLDVVAIEQNNITIPIEIRYLENSSTLANSSNEKLGKHFIYPNPSKGIFKTNIPENEIKSIEVYNLAGQLVSKSLNLSQLNNGQYIVKINTAKESISQKIIKN